MIETPYPGLRPFRRDEVNVFFGRDRQIDSMLAVLAGEGHFLAVTGASGAGKSSLVKTGLYSALELGYMRSAGAHWRIVEARPQTHPLSELREAFLEALGSDADDSIRGLIAAAVSRSPEAVAQSIGAIMEQKRESLLIVIDQFEELFRYKRTGADDEAFAFVAMLLQLAKQRRYPIYVVITVRSDYLGECAAFDGLAETVNKSLYLTPQMTRDELGEAITAPASVYGGSVEPALVARMLNDLERERDQLPLMQHALARLWEEASRANPDAPELTLDMYDKIGGVTGALEQHANSILAELGPRAYLAERMFRQLVGVTETADDVRNPTQFGQLLALTRSKREDLVPVIDAFRRPDRSFLAPPEGVLEDDTTIDITHESLIRQWPDLRAWATAEAADASQYRRIHESARLYRKGEEGLLTSPALENALAWRDRVKPTLEWATRHMSDRSKGVGARSMRRQAEHDFPGAMAFLDESERVARQEREAAELARQRETGRLRLRAASYLGLFVAALVGLLVVFLAYNNASTREAEALVLKAEAERDKADADRDKADAVRDKAEAEKKLTLANSVIDRATAFQADYLTTAAIERYDAGDIPSALALAAETDFMASHSSIDGLSDRVLAKLQDKLKLSGGTSIDTFGTVSKLTDTSGFNGDGKWVGIAQTGDGQTINVWNTDTGGTLNSVTINNDTPWLGSIVPGLDIAAVVKSDGEAVLLQLNGAGSIPLRAPTDANDIYSLSLGGAAGAERAVLATFTEARDGEMQLWDVSGGQSHPLSQATLLPFLDDDYPDTAFYDSKAGRYAVVTRDGAIMIGSVVNDQISIDGFLPKALFDSTTRHIHLDMARNRVIGLLDDCLFTMSLDGLVSEIPATPETPESGSVCDTAGSIIRLTSPILDTRLSDDGLTLTAANDSSREVIDLRPEHFGETLQYVSYLDSTHPALDVDLRTAAIVGNDSELNNAPTFYKSVVPGASVPCAGLCRFVARIDANSFIYADTVNAEGESNASLWRAHTTADGAIEVFAVGQEGFSALIGISRDLSSVALADASGSQGRIFKLDGNQALASFAIGSAPVAGQGLTVVAKPVMHAPSAGEEVRVGTQFTFSDSEAWPAYFVSPAPGTAPLLAAYSGYTDWLAVATEQGLELVIRSEAPVQLPDFASDRPTALTFSADGKALLVGTTRGDVDVLTLTATGIASRTLVGGFIDGPVDQIDMNGNDVVVVGGHDTPSIVKAKLDSSDPPEELDSLVAEWAGKTADGIVTLGVGPLKDGSANPLNRIQVWKWPSLKKTPEERALAIVTAQNAKVSTERLQDLYFIPEDLVASFTAHFGSVACAQDAVLNQEGTGIGCQPSLAKDSFGSDVLLGHGLELLQSESAFSLSSDPTFSGTPTMEGSASTDNIEEGQLFVAAAAAAGDGNALAVLADQLSPVIASSVTVEGTAYSERSLVPTFGWSATVDLLERIYSEGGPLPSVVLTLVTQLNKSGTSSSNQGQGADAQAIDPDEAIAANAAGLWRQRLNEPKYENDPVAKLARILLTEGAGMAPEDLLKAYAKLIAELDRPADQRAAGFARQRLAVLARSLGAQHAIDELRAAQASHIADVRVPTPVTLDPAFKAYAAALGDPTLADNLRPAAVASVLGSYLDMLSPATKASQPPFVEMRLLTERLDADAPAADLTALAGQITSRAYLLTTEYTPRGFVSALLLQLDSKDAPWRTDLERELLQRYAGLIGGDDATYDQQVMASAMRIIARGRDVTLSAEQQAAYDAVEHLVLRNFDAALDGFSYDSERLAAFNADLWALAAASERFVPGADTFVLAMKALIATTDEAVLKGAPALLQTYLSSGIASSWAKGNWSQSIYGYTSHAQALRNDAARKGDADAIRAEIALLQIGLDLDDTLTSAFSPGMTERLDRASALQVKARLETDLAVLQRNAGDEAAAISSYQDAIGTTTQALEFRLAAYNGNSYYGSTMDAIRESYSLIASSYERIDDLPNAVQAIASAIDFGRQAFEYDKSSDYLENYLDAYSDQLLYLSRQSPDDAVRAAHDAFAAVAALDIYDRQQARPGYIGQFLSRIAYALGSKYYSLQVGLVPDQCDLLAASAYDPLRLAPGLPLYRLADPAAAAAACEAALASAVTDDQKGRVNFQIGRAVERAVAENLSVMPEGPAVYYERAAQYGYPMGYLAVLLDKTSRDDGFFEQMATFYNLTLQRIAQPLTVYYDGLGTEEGQAIAEWLRGELGRVGQLDTHWLASDDSTSEDEGDV